MHYRTFTNIFSLYPLDAGSAVAPVVTEKNVSRGQQNYPWWTITTLLASHTTIEHL